MHIHLHCKGKEVLAMKFDGSSHDGSAGLRLPNKVVDYIEKNLPRINIPKDGIVEWVKVYNEDHLLLLP